MSNDDPIQWRSPLACYPSDIDAQIRLLEKYKRSKWDIIGRLPDRLATKVLLHLKLPDVGRLRLVSPSPASQLISRFASDTPRYVGYPNIGDGAVGTWKGETGMERRAWRISLMLPSACGASAYRTGTGR